MSDDLVKRLRFGSLTSMGSHRMNLEAADRIEQLEANLARAIAALEQSRDELDMYSWHEYPGDHPVQARYRKRDHDANPARIALAEIKGSTDGN